MPKMIPVNLSVADVHAAAGINPRTQVAAPTADDLDNWSQEAYSLSVGAAASLGFPVGNISGTFNRQTLVFGSSRWKDVADGNHTYRFGIALRTVVVVSNIQGGGALTLPVVAAKVELEDARASAQLLVRGYKGNALGGLLPAWQSFGVDSYAQYMNSISEIQKAIMADAANILPELLATTAVSSTVPSGEEAVGSVYALHAISEGATLAHAIDKLGVDDADILKAIRAHYQSAIGEGDNAAPDAQQRQDALHQLHGFHISRSWFSG